MTTGISQDLPIAEILPQVRSMLATSNRLVLAAPPGAGKTTALPLALMDEAWANGRILLLEPRRIAARMAARRMAQTLGEKVGQTIGLSTRIDREVSNKTRIEVITDGLFSRRLLNDPELSGVSAVLFDEFHERSLNAELGLALARDVQSALRPTLRILIMSATLDVEGIAQKLKAPSLTSEGTAFAVRTEYLGRTNDHIDQQMAKAIFKALNTENGSILAFLPGQAEIKRTMARLSDLPADVIIAPLYGALSPSDQDRAVSPAPSGHRKVVLATDIAESSLTIEGVTVVIDAGQVRTAEYDAVIGASRLVTQRVSLASADQRRGRAGRVAPGVCYRLWREPETRALTPAPTPEIATGDLSGLILSLAEWGVHSTDDLDWIDAPAPGRLSAARETLERLGALDENNNLTRLGKQIANVPLSPQLAAMIAKADDPSKAQLAAEIALTVSERGIGGSDIDVRERISRLRTSRADRDKTLRGKALRWVEQLSAGAKTKDSLPASVEYAGAVIAAGDPGRIARRIASERGVFQLASGRLAYLDADHPLAAEDWIAVADLTGAAKRARIVAAAPLTKGEAEALGQIQTQTRAVFDVENRAVIARRTTQIGAIILSETPLPKPDRETIQRALIDAVRQYGLDLIASKAAIRRFQARAGFALGEDAFAGALDDATLLTRAEEWLAPLIDGPRALDTISEGRLKNALRALMPWDMNETIDRDAPEEISLPSGRKLTIDYKPDASPTVSARAQEFFGTVSHPIIGAKRTPLTVTLLSPAQRPIATTTDLSGFWRAGYMDMVKDMRGRYPKHDWPDCPACAKPHAGRTKAALKRK